MKKSTSTPRAHWGSRMAFVLAAAGSAIGLGNIWKFPYITGVNGGGAFVLVYLACIAAVGLPIFIAELYIGQKGQKNTVQAFEEVYQKNTPWKWVGVMGLLSAYLILSFYSVVGGWVLEFVARSFSGSFQGHSDSEIQGYLGSLFANPTSMLFWHFVFMTLTVGMVMGGLKDGIERWNKILMPALLVLLLGLLFKAVMLPGFSEAVHFLFAPDFSKLTTAGLREAVGHAFFTLSLGMGAMVTYGSYLDRKESLPRVAISIAFMDTLVALIAGIVIFSIVFSYGLEAGAGPTLMFQTLPTLFAKLEGGTWVSIAFFLLVTFAALTSAISLLEVVVSYLSERFPSVSRRLLTGATGFSMYLLGIPAALSFNLLADTKIGSLTFFDLFDKSTSQITLPLGGLLISLFFGWVLGPKAVEAVVGSGRRRLSSGLLWTARIVAPLAVFAILAYGLL